MLLSIIYSIWEGAFERWAEAAAHATMIEDMDKPGYRLHALKGKLKGHWAIDISGNWRIVFKFENGDAYVVNYEDYL